MEMKIKAQVMTFAGERVSGQDEASMKFLAAHFASMFFTSSIASITSDVADVCFYRLYYLVNVA
jgi:hypothetical protein